MSSLHGRVRSPADLVHVHVGAMADSPAQVQLRRQFGVIAQGFDEFGDGLQALASGKIDAFVASRPVLRHVIANNFAGQLRVLATGFLRQDFVIALPLDSSLRKPINTSMLRFIQTDDWNSILRSYLSDE